MTTELSVERLTAWRDERYHRRPELKLRTEAQARAFVDQVGICLLFPVQGMELPNLWDAINGGQRAMPGHHDDYELSLTWDWKDTLPTRREIYYGKLLRKKATLVSLDLLPYFYALSGNLGDLEEDVRAPYEAGQLSNDARLVYEALLHGGAMTTNQMRRATFLEGQTNGSRFEGALTELQSGLKIVKVGISDANAWKYCYVYDLLPRWLPEAVTAARHITERDALCTILARYLETVGAATPQAVGRLFGWPPEDVHWAAGALQPDGRIVAGVLVRRTRPPWASGRADGRVAGAKGEYLGWAKLLDRADS